MCHFIYFFIDVFQCISIYAYTLDFLRLIRDHDNNFYYKVYMNDLLIQFNSHCFCCYEQRRRQATVAENVAIGTVIVQVQARDKDLGLSGEVTYRFAAHTFASYGQLFAIRNTTGAIYVTV